METGSAAKPAIVNASATASVSAGVTDRAAWVIRSPVFRGLTAAECASIASVADVRRLERGEMLFHEGDILRHVSLLASGRIKVTQLGPAGQQVILRLKVAGEIVSELGVLTGSLHSSTAESLERSQLLLWHKVTFDRFCDEFPPLARNVTLLLADRVQKLEERFRELATEQVSPRLARTLIRLLQQVGHSIEGGAVHIGLSREELAQLVGTTLFTVSRLLSEWEETGAVRAVRGAVIIQDQRRLLELIK